MLKNLYIVRHCQAVGQEANAPLTSEGNLQAIALADLLFGFGIELVISSPFIRAYQSITPLAERLSLSIEIVEEEFRSQNSGVRINQSGIQTRD